MRKPRGEDPHSISAKCRKKGLNIKTVFSRMYAKNISFKEAIAYPVDKKKASKRKRLEILQ